MEFNSNGLLEELWKEQTELAADSQDPSIISIESIWVSKDGKRKRIKNMDNRHLLNSIRVLMGKSLIGTKWNGPESHRKTLIDVMANEAYRRGLTLLNDDEGKGE